MKNHFIKRAVSLLLALVCVLGILPLSAFAADGPSSAPSSITQRSSDYMYSGGRPVRYSSASDVINAEGRPYVFNEQVDVPGFGTTRALCAYQVGTLGGGANGQRWNFKNEVTHPSLKLLLTFIYSSTYDTFTDAGHAVGCESWRNSPMWSDAWYVVGQAMTWYYEHGILIDCTADKEGFIRQASEEMVAVFKMFHDTWNSTAWITDWSKVDVHTIIDSNDNGATGYSAYDYISTAVNLVQDHPEYFRKYSLWEYEWDSSQPWKLPGQEKPPCSGF